MSLNVVVLSDGVCEGSNKLIKGGHQAQTIS